MSHGNQRAMEQDAAAVIRQYAPFVWRTLRHLGVPENQLEDVSQDVLMVVFRKLSEFEGRSALSTWIYGVCRNVAATARRSSLRRRELPTDTVPEAAVRELQSTTLVQREARERLNKALQALPESKRMVFVLFEIECLSLAEVAEAVGCNESTAASRLYSARAKVRSALVRAGILDSNQAILEVV